MLVDTAITNIKTATSHDSDDQVTAAQYLAWVQLEQDRIRVHCALAIPSLYTSTQSNTLSGTTTISKPADFLALVRFEKLVGTKYWPVWTADGLSTHGLGGLEFREEATNFEVAPTEESDGTYKMTYVTKGATLTSALTTPPGSNATIEVPLGLEDVLSERVAARVRERCYEDAAPHYKRADDLWKELFPLIKRRYGRHSVPGLRRVRGDI